MIDTKAEAREYYEHNPQDKEPIYIVLLTSDQKKEIEDFSCVGDLCVLETEHNPNPGMCEDIKELRKLRKHNDNHIIQSDLEDVLNEIKRYVSYWDKHIEDVLNEIKGDNKEEEKNKRTENPFLLTMNLTEIRFGGFRSDVRVTNLLKREGFNTVQEVLDYPIYNLMKIEGLGRVAFTIITMTFYRLGIVTQKEILEYEEKRYENKR